MPSTARRRPSSIDRASGDPDLGLGIVLRDHDDPHPALLLGFHRAGQDLTVPPFLDLEEPEERPDGLSLAGELLGAIFRGLKGGQESKIKMGS
jgi:hypothetical protein